MNQRTLTIYRNWGRELVFEDLPAEVHVAATLKTKGSTVRIVSVSPLRHMELAAMENEKKKARESEVWQLIDASQRRPMTDDRPWLIRNVVQPTVSLYSSCSECCAMSCLCLCY